MQFVIVVFKCIGYTCVEQLLKLSRTDGKNVKKRFNKYVFYFVVTQKTQKILVTYLAMQRRNTI